MTGLADALRQQGGEVAVYADRVRAPGAGELQRRYPIHRFALWRPIRRLMKRRIIAQALAQTETTGVFTDSWKSVSAVPRGAGPIVTLAHGSEFPQRASIIKRWRINRALRRCKAIVASSNYTADLLAPFLDGVKAKVLVVNPPIPPLPEAQAPALAEVDALIAGRSPVVATLARLEARKGVDQVLQAIAALREEFPQLVYLIAGAGPDMARLKRLTRSLSIEDRVAYMGEIVDPQKKAALLTRCDLYAMPSRRVGNSVEGFGISYVEAGWYGVASIGGDNSGAGDAIIDSATGYICRGEADADVRRPIAQLLRDATLRREFGGAAAILARQKFTWAASLPRYLAALGN